MGKERCFYISIGIDVGADFSLMAAALPSQEIVGKPYKILHSSRRSVQGAIDRIFSLSQQYSLPARIYMESTGIYHLPLYSTKNLAFYVDKQCFDMVILFLRLGVRRELIIRRDGRAVEGTGLENRRCESIRGFESHSLRQLNFSIDLRKYPRGRRGSPAKGVGRVKSVAEVQILSSAPEEKHLKMRCFSSFLFSFVANPLISEKQRIFKNRKNFFYCLRHCLQGSAHIAPLSNLRLRNLPT